MSEKTAISWCDSTVNFWRGCTKVSPGCANCYAETLALTRLAGREGYPGLPWTPENAAWNVALRPERLDQPLRWRKPRRIFVNSMSDLFHSRVPEAFLDRVFVAMAVASQHRYQVLTKRPERMRDYLANNDTRNRLASALVEFAERTGMVLTIRGAGDGLPGIRFPSVWLGTSVENQHWADLRIPHLLATPAAVRFLSVEPLLGPIEFSDVTGRSDAVAQLGRKALAGIDWVIVGGESGPGHRPMDPAWLASVVRQCDEAQVPVFVKQDSGPRSGMQGRIPDSLWALFGTGYLGYTAARGWEKGKGVTK